VRGLFFSDDSNVVVAPPAGSVGGAGAINENPIFFGREVPEDNFFDIGFYLPWCYEMILADYPPGLYF